jgi:hypothetical protein
VVVAVAVAVAVAAAASNAQALGGIPFAFWHPNTFSQYYYQELEQCIF